MSAETSAQRPRATYRIQFTKEFGFRKATEIVPYLATLGISHLYASPYLKARPGSTHGYDIVDHNSLNPELGTDADFAEMCAALKAHGIGQILDFVPNHMGVGGSDNVWWLSVLEWGPDSHHAGYFDIDWRSEAPGLRDKVLVPVLGDQYGVVLESGDLELRFDAEAGSFAVWAYGTHKLPICPLHYHLILGTEHSALERLGDAFSALPDHRPNVVRRADELKSTLSALVREDTTAAAAALQAVACLNGDPDRLDAAIQKQHWRAAFFQVASDDINYRRFFNINELAGLRMEQPELFDVAHRFILERLADGTLDGIRIDHIDGLLDPLDYCKRLRAEAGRPFYLVVEKILARHERLRETWPIEGTTGYEFGNLVGGLFVDSNNEGEFTRLYGAFTGRTETFDSIVHACKIHIMESEMASELNALARGAARIARSNRKTCDFTTNILHAAIKEAVARFPVYRTYIDDTPPTSEDRRDIDWAIAQARRAANAPNGSVFDFLHSILTTDLVAHPKSGFSREAVVRLAMKVQQYSGPVMAKGLEDTAFYRYNRLVSLNEVGGQPDQFGVTIAAFHQANAERAKHWPYAMLSTSTHDTKRGEDVRARISVLSEIPEEWERNVHAWSRIVRARRGDVEGTSDPDRNDEYLIYQLMLGAWPSESFDTDSSALEAFATRIEEAMVKSVREAKVHSTWAAPNADYEDALKSFVRDCLDTSRSNPFLELFKPFQARVARLGMLNSLAQTLIKLTAPGVPDLYQGTEFWDLSLVDPDNRRPVDYDKRKAALDGLGPRSVDASGSLGQLLAHWTDGTVKLALTTCALDLRRKHPALFSDGSYEPLQVHGSMSDHVCGFARQLNGICVLTIVPRLLAAKDGTPDWADTSIELLKAYAGARWRNALARDASAITQVDEALSAGEFFRDFPVALLISGEEL